jgi:pyruvate ferredoxin oxidoreductase alpha subunit
MSNFEALQGNEAIATAMRQINPDVVAAYPITPQTSTVQKFADFVSDGLVDTEFVCVESEHSAMSACVGASAAGARVMTATAANGLALMWEIVYIAASNRCPIVMSLVNRALSAPINIHCDHSDVMGMRDSGWIILFSENGQEAYDNLIQAVRIGEHPDVLLPVAVCQDGFITSHALEKVEIFDDDAVKDFVGAYNARWPLLDIENPKTYGPLDFYDYYYEHKRQQVEAMENVQQVILDVAAEFNEKFNRNYGLFETHDLEDADVAIVAANSTAGTTKVVVDRLRDEGMKVGLLKPRVFRPFPAKELAGDGPLHFFRGDEQRRAPVPGAAGGTGGERRAGAGGQLCLRPGWTRHPARRDRTGLPRRAQDRRDGAGGADGDVPEREGVNHGNETST